MEVWGASGEILGERPLLLEKRLSPSPPSPEE